MNFYKMHFGKKGNDTTKKVLDVRKNVEQNG